MAELVGSSSPPAVERRKMSGNRLRRIFSWIAFVVVYGYALFWFFDSPTLEQASDALEEFVEGDPFLPLSRKLGGGEVVEQMVASMRSEENRGSLKHPRATDEPDYFIIGGWLVNLRSCSASFSVGGGCIFTAHARFVRNFKGRWLIVMDGWDVACFRDRGSHSPDT